MGKLINEYLEKHFFIANRDEINKHIETNSKKEICINKGTLLENKIKTISQNKGNKAWVKYEGFPQKYLLGIIEPKDNIAFGLKITKNINEKNKNHYLPIFYRDLDKMIIYSN